MLKSLDKFINNTSDIIVDYIFRDVKPKTTVPPLNGEIKILEELSSLLHLMEVKRDAKYNR